MAKKRFAARENPQLYEINTAAWLHELSERLGKKITLGDVPQQEWARLKDLGTDFVWLMGVWRRSPWGRRMFVNDPTTPRVAGSVLPGWTVEDIIGSSYSIDAYEPDPLVGGWEDIDRARSSLRQLSIGVILDFIPNHTGPDFAWVTTHPEYYIQGRKGDHERNPGAFFAIGHGRRTLYLAKGKDPNFCPWSDTVQVNYFNPAARRALINELQKVADHCDGVRCDMAQLVLNNIFRKTWGWADRGEYRMPQEEFWTQAISTVPGLVWIAEAYWATEAALIDLGFDFVYDKTLYDRLRAARGYDVYMHLAADAVFQKKLLRFIENHDEERCAAAFGRERSLAAATILATIPGLRLYHQGQFEGRKIRLPLQIIRAREETHDPGVAEFYGRLLPIASQEVFHGGDWRIREVMPAGWDDSFRNLLAYRWRLEGQMKLVVVNLSPDFAQGRIPLECDLPADRDYLLFDELNDQGYERSGRSMAHPGLHVMLSGYRAHIFDVQPAK